MPAGAAVPPLRAPRRRPAARSRGCWAVAPPKTSRTASAGWVSVEAPRSCGCRLEVCRHQVTSARSPRVRVSQRPSLTNPLDARPRAISSRRRASAAMARAATRSLGRASPPPSTRGRVGARGFRCAGVVARGDGRPRGGTAHATRDARRLVRRRCVCRTATRRSVPHSTAVLLAVSASTASALIAAAGPSEWSRASSTLAVTARACA